MPRRGLTLLVLLLTVLLPAAPSRGEGERFAEEPTVGMQLPAAPLAGDHDATAVTQNPAGLVFLGGFHLELAYTGLDDDAAGGPGAGLGFWAAAPLALPFFPRLGFGVGIERLDPPRGALAPDPGEPLKLSLATSWVFGPGIATGFAWHHFADDEGGPLDGTDTFDFGISMRLGGSLALGLVVRDAFTPVVAAVPVQRRWQGELVWRPLGTDRLELGLGASVGERRHDVDPSLRFGVRLGRGIWLRGDAAARSRWVLADPLSTGGAADLDYDLRASLGLEVSFGGVGTAFYGTGGVGVDGEARMAGGTGIVRWSGERYPSVVPPADHAERIELSGELSERALLRVLLRMRRLERDDSVAVVVLAIDGVGVGWAGAQELREAVARLRQRGKSVVAFMVAGGTRDYYVASAADKIYLDAAGGLRVQGLSSTVLFFKELFDKLGVLAQFEKIEEYKSAPEAFTRETSSDEARMVRESLLGDIYERIVADLAADRGREVEEVKAIIENGPYTAAEAEKAKLVDGLVEPLGGGLDVHEGGGAPAERPDRWSFPQLAVVVIEGDIVDGKSMNVPLLGRRLVGGDTIAASIAWARDNPAVEAIVIRVNSPGGSALASEKIAREIFSVRGKKPVIVSMGDVAASGGYFAAAPGDVIFAEPSTITGSIGIFSGKFDVSELARRAGLTWETSQRGAHADMESYFRPYTEEERAAIKEKLRYYYGRFIGAVAKGRGMTEEQVDAVGRGRVWTGAQAKEQKLVDRFGGIIDAISLAKQRAGIGEDERAEIILLPLEPRSVVEQLLRLAGGGAAGAPALAGLPALDVILRALPASILVAPSSPQARLPFAVVIE